MQLLRLAISLACALPAAAQDAKPVSKTIQGTGLTITLPAEFENATERPLGHEQVKARWKARLGGANLDVTVFVMTNVQFGFEEPEDVTDVVLANARDPKRGGDPSFAFESLRLVQGPFGYASFASIGHGPVHESGGTKIASTFAVLGGLLPGYGYAVEVGATPALAEAELKIVLAFLEKGVRCDGTPRNTKWTDVEARRRWLESAPEKTHEKLEKPFRTAHYVILTNSAAGKKFGEKMEECYAAIRKVYPFAEVDGRMLMPVYLFRDKSEYSAFFAKYFETSVAEADKSKGVASGEFYATYYDAPQDPVHVHEATHQIFRNRLRLPGAGSWFQEGVAEYMSTIPNDRTAMAHLVRKRKHTPLAEFVKIESLLFSPKSDDVKGDEAEASYTLAALLVEFLRESKWGKDKFQDFVHTVGLVPRNDVAAIERAVRTVYGTDLAGLETQWVEYCKKR